MLKLAVVIAVFVVYGLFSRRLEQKITGPMVFMTVGILLAEPFLDWFSLDLRAVSIQILLNGALALVLFTEAATLGAHRIEGTRLSSRLLLIALPLVMIGGLVFALVLFDVLTFWEAAVIGVLLSPTDAALGQPIIENDRLPHRIRSGLVIEGGLNDGLAVPFVLFAAAAAEVAAGQSDTPALVELILTEVGIATAIGILVGWGGAKSIRLAIQREWAQGYWIDLTLLSLAFFTFVLAQGLHASGFIAAWVAGLTIGRLSDPTSERHRRFSQNESSILVMLAFLTFGALAVGPLLERLTWQVALYAALSLAVVRPLAVTFSLIGSGDDLKTIAFLGWFGPRGLPTLVLALILVFEGFEFGSSSLMLEIVVFTVVLSVYAHGLTAAPLGSRFADSVDGAVSSS